MQSWNKVGTESLKADLKNKQILKINVGSRNLGNGMDTRIF
jgi:hypothetical protein